MVIRAKYENVVFKPIGAVGLKEGTVVELEVPPPSAGTIRVSGLPFVGLFKRRRDIPDGITSVNRLRDKARYH